MWIFPVNKMDESDPFNFKRSQEKTYNNHSAYMFNANRTKQTYWGNAHLHWAPICIAWGSKSCTPLLQRQSAMRASPPIPFLYSVECFRAAPSPHPSLSWPWNLCRRPSVLTLTLWGFAHDEARESVLDLLHVLWNRKIEKTSLLLRASPSIS